MFKLIDYLCRCLVNNAASLVFADASWQPRWLVRKQLGVNLEGALALTVAFLPTLREAAKENKIAKPRYMPLYKKII